jgi:DNA-binding Lrp family transcriptional regulator
MPHACVLVKTTPVHTESVLQEVRKIKGVRKAFVAYGRFDLVVFARIAHYGETRGISAAVNKLEGVRSTETLPEA